MKKLFLFLILAAPFVAKAQSSDYYRSPVDIPVLLSANFGEMRVSRFHTGIDIKTQGVVGHTLRAAADGYVSRVTVAPNGYGRALYIMHPNGTMTVYAHLEGFRADIEEYLRAERYDKKRSDIDCFPEASRFPVKKGDIIGKTGNSGRSTGPHLHYEVRRSSNSRSLNTLTNGWIVAKDDIAPRIVKLYQIDVDTIMGVPVHSRPVPYEVVEGEGGTYSLLQYSPVEVGPTSYFVIEATDRKNDVANTFGIYRARLTVDGEEKVIFEKDAVLFDEVKYCIPSVLYDIQRESRNEVLMLALKSGNKLGMYKKTVDRGVLRVSENEIKQVEITIEDDAENAVSLAFNIILDTTRALPELPAAASYSRVASDRADFRFSAEGLTVSIPKGALYEPIFYTQQVVEIDVPARSDGIYPLSKIYKLGDGGLPLHSSARISITAPDVPENLRTKARLASVSADGHLYSAGGSYSGGVVSGNVGAFGTYCVAFDATAPVVKSSFASGANLSAEGQITITATDNFSGVSWYTGSIDGEWIIFERNVSARQYIHKFDTKKLQTGRTHAFVFTCGDSAGNTTTWRGTFYK